VTHCLKLCRCRWPASQSIALESHIQQVQTDHWIFARDVGGDAG
jgi:hypothetical protein